MQPQNDPNVPAQQQAPSPQASPPGVVHVSRPLDPAQPHISAETQQKHDESKAKYPDLDLSLGEFVIAEVHRHPFGLMQIWLFSGLIIVVLMTAVIWLTSSAGGASGLAPLLAIPLLIVVVLVGIGAAVGTFVFSANRFYLTNESVIQYIQNSMFDKKLQTVSLGNIEDASYSQQGIVAHIFNYGMIRLSTEGDETTYRFNYASQPQKQVALLNNAVEAFKNGRPVEEY